MIAIIVNPVSGNGQNAQLAEQARDILAQRGLESRMYETQCAGDGEARARRALEEGCTMAVCIGGDGTLSEAVCALAGSGCVLMIVPGGTGNDFARALGLPKDPVAALKMQLDGKRTQIDCGSINGQAFLNVSGSGFDVDVLRKTAELKQTYPGETAYRKAVLSVLGSYKPFLAEVSVDGGAFRTLSSTIVEIANGQYIGGGMKVAPGARVRDGLFDVVRVNRVPRLLIPFLLPLFILGVHVHLPIVSVTRAREVVLRAKGMVVNIDGRLEEMDEARFKIMPSALTMMLPEKRQSCHPSA